MEASSSKGNAPTVKEDLWEQWGLLQNRKIAKGEGRGEGGGLQDMHNRKL